MLIVLCFPPWPVPRLHLMQSVCHNRLCQSLTQWSYYVSDTYPDRNDGDNLREPEKHPVTLWYVRME